MNTTYIHRSKKTNENSVEVCVDIVQDDRLSAEARGVYATLMALPDDTPITKKYVSTLSSSGRDKTNSAFKELIKHGIIEEITYTEGGLKKKLYLAHGTRLGKPKGALQLAEKPTNLYLMRDEKNGCVKLGVAKKPKVRERTLQSERPFIVLEWTTPCMLKHETILHEMFKEKRIRGEWFDLSEEDISYVKSEAWKGSEA